MPRIFRLRSAAALAAAAAALAVLPALPGNGSALLAQVPEYSVTMTPGAYDTLFTRDIFDDTYLSAPFSSHDTVRPEAKIRFKGHSTRYYAKKSYRIRMATSNLFYGYRDVNFNSMYTDKSLMREKLAWDLFADLGTLAPTGYQAEFVMNGVSKGLFLFIPKIDKYLLQLNGRQIAPMYEADDYYNSADLTLQPDSILKLYWAKEIGDPGDYSDLHALIGALNSAPGASFADTLRQWFDTTSILRWFAVNTLTMMGDSYNKNYFLYRDTSKPAQQWTVIPWDYDLSWGRTGDPAVPYPASLLNDGFAYSFNPLSGPSSVLKDRFMATPELWEGFRSYLSGVISTLFTEAHLWPRIDSIAGLIRPAAAADPERWGTMEDFDEHVEALKYYVTARRNFLLKTFINPPSGEYNTATLPFAGEGAAHHFTGYDGRLLATLWLSGVTGLDSITVRVHPDSTPPDVAAPGDGRYVRRWVEVIAHPPSAQFTARFRWSYHDLSSLDREVAGGVSDERLLRAYHHGPGGWSTLPASVNSFANTVTMDSVPGELFGASGYFALLLSETYQPTWAREANNYWERLHDIRFTDSLHGFIAGEHGSFLTTADGGDTWERDSIRSALHFFSAGMTVPPGRIFASGEAGSLYRSDDTGRTWTGAAPGTGAGLRAVSFAGRYGVVAGDSGIAFTTEDSGSTWVAALTGLTESLSDARYYIDPIHHLVVAGDQVRIFSEPLNPIPPAFWVLVRSFPLTHTPRALDLVGTTLWAAGDSGLVATGGVDDTALTERNLPEAVRLNAVAALDSLRVFVAGEGGAVWYTADGGLNWYRQLTGSTNDLNAIAFTGTGRGYAVGNGGTILRTDVPGTLTGVEESAPLLPSAFRLLQNYPNPFNPATTIAFDLASDAAVSIDVFDVLGRLVASPLRGSAAGDWYPAGRHTLRWSAERLASGVYFYRMTAADRSGRALHISMKKMVLVR